MQMRHRIPVIFSLSMLDMLCCALGAVIFLMILNMWDAGRQAKVLAIERKRVSETAQHLDESQGSLKDSQTTLNSTQEELKQLQAKIGTMEEEAEKTKTRLTEAEQKLEEAQKAVGDKEKERTALAANIEALKKDLADQQRMAKEARDRLEEAQKQHASATESAAQVPGLQKELAGAQKQSQAVQAELAALRKQIDEQKSAVAQVRQQLATTEGRFAGIDLGGKRVVCLVDMSGSMGSVDAKTLDPNKWPEVRRAVVQVLKSLPDVTHYQVIVFSSEVQFLLGKPGEWLSFNRDISPEAVGQALARVQPSGDTNLYAAFDSAFRFRPQGLDTVFLFSDGLPNVGPGLTADAPKDEYVRGAMLGNYLRQTIRTRWNQPDASLATQGKGQSDGRVRIHSVGFFYESPNLGAFLWALSRENGGSFVGMSKP